MMTMEVTANACSDTIREAAPTRAASASRRDAEATTVARTARAGAGRADADWRTAFTRTELRVAAILLSVEEEVKGS